MLAHPETSRSEWPSYEVAPRSRLFSMAPIGLGKWDVESLTSYLVRLARAHAVSPRLLLKTEFTQAMPELAGVINAGFFGRYAGTMNGLGLYAESFSEAAIRLSTVGSLRQLTLLPLKELLPHNGAGLLAAQPQWCPVCLAEMEESFRPLIWSFKLYRVCNQHHTSLENRCPTCGKRQPFIPRYPALNICTYCGQPLAITPRTNQVSESDIWLALALKDFVVQLAHLEPLLTRESFLVRVARLVEFRYQGNRAAFLRDAGLPRWFLNHWFNKGERPSFVQLMRLCSGLGIRPADLFQMEGTQSSPRVAGNPIARRSPRRLTSTIKREYLHTLNRILSAAHDSRPAYVVAEKLGLSRSGLRYLFPDQYIALRDRSLKARTQRASARYRMLVLKIQALMDEMRARGEYPGRRKINQQLRQYGASLSELPLLAAYRKELMA